MAAPAQRQLDRAHSLLRSPRRRYIVSYLSDEGEGDVEDLAARIATREREQSADAVEAEARRRVAVALVHDHLPRLADHDVVEYDPESGAVASGAELDDLASILSRYQASEDVSGVLTPSA